MVSTIISDKFFSKLLNFIMFLLWRSNFKINKKWLPNFYLFLQYSHSRYSCSIIGLHGCGIFWVSSPLPCHWAHLVCPYHSKDDKCQLESAMSPSPFLSSLFQSLILGEFHLSHSIMTACTWTGNQEEKFLLLLVWGINQR